MRKIYEILLHVILSFFACNALFAFTYTAPSTDNVAHAYSYGHVLQEFSEPQCSNAHLLSCGNDITSLQMMRASEMVSTESDYACISIGEGKLSLWLQLRGHGEVVELAFHNLPQAFNISVFETSDDCSNLDRCMGSMTLSEESASILFDTRADMSYYIMASVPETASDEGAVEIGVSYPCQASAAHINCSRAIPINCGDVSLPILDEVYVIDPAIHPDSAGLWYDIADWQDTYLEINLSDPMGFSNVVINLLTNVDCDVDYSVMKSYELFTNFGQLIIPADLLQEADFLHIQYPNLSYFQRSESAAIHMKCHNGLIHQDPTKPMELTCGDTIMDVINASSAQEIDGQCRHTLYYNILGDGQNHTFTHIQDPNTLSSSFFQMLLIEAEESDTIQFSLSGQQAYTFYLEADRKYTLQASSSCSEFRSDLQLTHTCSITLDNDLCSTPQVLSCDASFVADISRAAKTTPSLTITGVGDIYNAFDGELWYKLPAGLDSVDITYIEGMQQYVKLRIYDPLCLNDQPLQELEIERGMSGHFSLGASENIILTVSAGRFFQGNLDQKYTIRLNCESTNTTPSLCSQSQSLPCDRELTIDTRNAVPSGVINCLQEYRDTWYSVEGQGQTIEFELLDRPFENNLYCYIYEGNCDNISNDCSTYFILGSYENNQQRFDSYRRKFFFESGIRYTVRFMTDEKDGAVHRIRTTCLAGLPTSNNACPQAKQVFCGDTIFIDYEQYTIDFVAQNLDESFAGEAWNFEGGWWDIVGNDEVYTLSRLSGNGMHIVNVYSGDCSQPVLVNSFVLSSDSPASAQGPGILCESGQRYWIYVSGIYPEEAAFRWDCMPIQGGEVCTNPREILCEARDIDSIANTNRIAVPLCYQEFDLNSSPGKWYNVPGTGDVVQLNAEVNANCMSILFQEKCDEYRGCYLEPIDTMPLMQTNANSLFFNTQKNQNYRYYILSDNAQVTSYALERRCDLFELGEPCICNNDRTSPEAQDGTFSEMVYVKDQNPNHTWSVKTISLGISPASTPQEVNRGDILQYNDVDSNYQIHFSHVENVGYQMEVEGPYAMGDPKNVTLHISNKCQYPSIRIENLDQITIQNGSIDWSQYVRVNEVEGGEISVYVDGQPYHVNQANRLALGDHTLRVEYEEPTTTCAAVALQSFQVVEADIIPTLSAWSIMILALLLLIVSVVECKERIFDTLR